MAQILIVEDSRTQAAELRHILQSAGFDAAVVASGEQAAVELVKTKYDLILSDVVMPGMSGYDLCRRIKADPILQQIPVILLTSLNHPMDVVRGLESGADNFVTKPFESAYLIGRVQSILANKAARAGRKTQLGIDLVLLGSRVTITSEREQILDVLISTFEELMRSKDREHEVRVAEESTRKSLEFLQSAMDALTAAIAIVDSTGRIVAVNAAWASFAKSCAAFGHDAGVGANYLERCRSNESETSALLRNIEAAVVGVLDGSQTFAEVETPFHCDGQTAWYLVRISPFLGDGARMAVVAHEDITLRKKAEAELRFANDLIEQTTQPVVAADLSRHWVRFNRAFEQLVQYDRDTLRQMTYLDVTPTRWHATDEEVVQQLMALRKPVRYEKEFQRSDGTAVPVELIADSYRNGTNVPKCIYAFVTDISERKWNERRREAQYQLAKILTDSADLLDAAHRVLVVLVETLEWAFAALWLVDRRAPSLQCIATASARPEVYRELDEATRATRIEAGDTLPGRVLSDGAAIWFGDLGDAPDQDPRTKLARSAGLRTTVAFPVKLGDELYGVFELFHDRRLPRDEASLHAFAIMGNEIGQFVARKRLEEQFYQAQKMDAIGRVAGGVAHDFNNLLTVINGYSEILGRKLASDPKLREMAINIREAGDRAGALTRQLLVFSRKHAVTPTVLCLNDVIRQMLKMLPRLIGADIQLATALEENLGQVKVDSSQLEQVVLNLAVNARDAMPRGGELIIETNNVTFDESYCAVDANMTPGRYVLLAVTDNGCGMDDYTKSRIFEPFFTTKDPGKGTGLGLATVFGIVNQSGGRIYVYSEQDVGTTFKIYFPRVDDPVSGGEQTPAETSMPQGTETILLVENEDHVRKLAATVLTSSGYTVFEASSGQDALDRWADKISGIDLLATDVVMPGMSGKQLADQLRKLRPALKVIFLSGYTDETMTRHGILESDSSFLQKPFSPASLARKVRDVLDQKV